MNFFCLLLNPFAHSGCIQSLRCTELRPRFRSGLNTLFPHLIQCWIFTCTQRIFLMFISFMFPQGRFPARFAKPLLPAWEGTAERCSPSILGLILPDGVWKWRGKWVALTEHLRTWKELLFPVQLSKEAKGQRLLHYLFQPIFPSLLEAQTKVAHAESCRWISNQAYSCTYLALKHSC